MAAANQALQHVAGSEHADSGNNRSGLGWIVIHEPKDFITDVTGKFTGQHDPRSSGAIQENALLSAVGVFRVAIALLLCNPAGPSNSKHPAKTKAIFRNDYSERNAQPVRCRSMLRIKPAKDQKNTCHPHQRTGDGYGVGEANESPN